MKPLAIDLFCGLGGWTEGLLAEGWNVIGFDIERHAYGAHHYPTQLVLQDVRTIDGAQFKDASLIVASPPCQEFSYMAMPWKRAKHIADALRCADDFPRGYTGSRSVPELTSLFDACFRIQREACDAAGRHIPLVVENVRGAQPWVGRARWQFGSFCLWGDVPALMPITLKVSAKVPGQNWNRFNETGETSYFNVAAERATKNSGGSWFNVAHNTVSGTSNNPVRGPRGGKVRHDPRYPHLDPNTAPLWEREDGTKQGGDWFSDPAAHSRRSSSKSSARKAAAARIAKIPETLARHIARVYLPRPE